MVSEKSGKNKNFIFQGQEKVGNSLKSQKRLKMKIGTLVVYKKSKQMLACITGIIFRIFRRAKSKREVSEEHQTHVMGEGAVSVLLTQFTLAFAHHHTSLKK